MPDFEGLFLPRKFFFDRQKGRFWRDLEQGRRSVKEFFQSFGNINQKSSYFWKKSFVTYFSIFQKNQKKKQEEKHEEKTRRKNKKKSEKIMLCGI